MNHRSISLAAGPGLRWWAAAFAALLAAALLYLPALAATDLAAIQAQVEAGQTAEAIEAATGAIDSGKLAKSDLAEAYFIRGSAHEARQEWNRSLADYRKAKALNPEVAKYGWAVDFIYKTTKSGPL